MPTLLSIGHGYTAQALARVLGPQGWDIHATTRNPATAERLRATGVRPLMWPIAGDLPAASHVLCSVAPGAAGDPVLAELAPRLMALAPQWVGYLSTTAVYGDHGGAWVDEATPLTPDTERGRWRVAAEAEWRATGLPLDIFRLAGIYGPGRGPFEKLRNGTARRIVKPGQVFSRIHVEDIAQALQAAMGRGAAGGAFNLCDDLPAPPEDVIAEAARLLELPVPPAEDWDRAEMTPMARSFYSESKRVRNLHAKAVLGLQLRYPTYHEGLRADLASERRAAGQPDPT